MSHYQHLSIMEREKILVLYTEGKSLRSIATIIGRSASTISRELSRNSNKKQSYSAIIAQEKYAKRRKKCVRLKLLDRPELREKVLNLFLTKQWSPEQISQRLSYEESPYQISYNTIYRAINSCMLHKKRFHKDRGLVKNLRHRGKTRRRKGTTETRGKIVISNRIQDRPAEADERKVIGHWEADTVIGKPGSACLVTVVDRCSRYLLAGKVAKRRAPLLRDRMVALLSNLPDKVKTITPDRGKEFAKHDEITKSLGGVPFYFADPHSPWQRGSNENTNGLLREYLPRSSELADFSDEDIARIVDNINKRPRKCLGWRSPFEVFFDTPLHLT